jgi:hypothetical protein
MKASISVYLKALGNVPPLHSLIVRRYEHLASCLSLASSVQSAHPNLSVCLILIATRTPTLGLSSTFQPNILDLANILLIPLNLHITIHILVLIRILLVIVRLGFAFHVECSLSFRFWWDEGFSEFDLS